MRLTAALEFEKLREEESTWRRIVLHRDGKFYHAYNWSAWLVKNYVCTEQLQKQRGDDKMLAVNRYTSKNGEYAMLGFPVDSIGKYIPTYEDARKMEEGDDLEISVAIDFDGESYESLQTAYEEWFGSCPVKDKKSKSVHAVSNSDGQTPAMARSGMFNILSQLLAYPVEEKTPTENLAFIGSLKKQVAALL